MKCSLILVGVLLLVAITAASSEHHGKAGSSHQANSGEQKAYHLKKSGKKYSHDHEKSQKGKSDVALHKKEEAEKGGKKHHALEEGSHHVQSHDQGHGGHGANYKHAERQKKAGLEKGFREQYHKDEQKKSDAWYSNKHKSGEWIKFGANKSKHHAYKHDKDAHGKYQNGKHSEKHGKESKYGQGHAKLDHKAHQGNHGSQSQYSKHEEYGKKKIHNRGH